MKKILFAIGLAVLMLLMCACNNAPDTVSTPTPTTVPTETEVQKPAQTLTQTPQDTQTNAPTLEPTAEPTSEPTEVETFWDDDKILENAHFYGTAFESWPFTDNGTWCPHAFFHTMFIIHSTEADFSENVGTDDYEYTWQIYYFDKGADPTSYQDMNGPYTVSINTIYKFEPNGEGNIIYRINIGDCPEGMYFKNFEADKEYTFYFEIKKGEEIVGCAFADQIWTPLYDNYAKVYIHFWENHDRSLGITSGTHEKTNEDCSYEYECGFDERAKPVIYLYPEEPTDVSVKLDVWGELAFTYPEYKDGWNVTAYPDGTLIDKETGREYSYLFWEAFSYLEYDMSKGFVVKGEDTAEFLQNILAKIGLTPREYNEMIVYWLPLMQNNKYNLITFQTEAYTDSAKLYIDPAPDSLLRVFMVFKSIDEPIEIEEPVFETFERNGFTVVEWGGSEIKQ